MRIALVAGVLATKVMPAQAQWFIDGNKLLSMCESPNKAWCEAYVTEAYDTYVLVWAANTEICIPANATSTQLRDAVIQYLQAHPEGRHEPAMASIVRGLVAAFPCPTSGAEISN